MTSISRTGSVDRRGFLAGAAVVAAGLAAPRLVNPAVARAAVPAGAALFTLGVASGDPTPEGVVLWTRLAPDPLNGGGMPARPVEVRWELAADPAMKRIIRKGRTLARPELAHSVHVEVDDLEAGAEYWYRFIAEKQDSPVGRTLTAPDAGEAAGLRLAFVSCQDWQNGYWPAYQHLAADAPDLVVHLGDYIYEYGPEAKTRPGAPPARVHDGPEVNSLESYRNRHALYKTDPALQAAHAVAPWVVTFDDHEVENNYAGLTRELPLDPAGQDFAVRRANAYQAYYEHMPLRRTAIPTATGIRLYRRLGWGRLVELNVLDTRQFRTDQPCGDGLANCAGRFDPGATMTGAEQEAWLLDGLRRSRARWNVLANQTIFSQVDFNPFPGHAGPGGLFNVDQWDGYVAQRQRIIEFLATERPSNPVIITGDIHSSWAMDVKADWDDMSSQTVASELVGTSISSDFPAPFVPAVRAALPDNPHIRFFDGIFRGYVLNHVGRDEWRAEFRAVSTVDQPVATVSTLATFVVEDGVPGVQAA